MTKKLFDLTGKVVVITGGAGHLGESMCEGLAEFGANIIIASPDPKGSDGLVNRLVKKFNIEAFALKMDIAKPGNIKKAFEKASKKFSGIDILINNAYFGSSGRLEKITDKDWQKGIDGTINGVFRCTQLILPYFENAGVIINIASMYGMVSPDPRVYGGDPKLENPPNYGSGKAAILQFTRYAACHLAPRGIRVNSISPGAFPNKLVQKNRRFVAKLKNKIPLGRIGTPNDLKGAVVFLASDASSYITGSNIVVDGGWTAW